MNVRNVSEVMAAGPRAPSQARRLVARALETWGQSDLGERAVLAVSELVTNAFLYGRGDIVLLVSLGDSLRVEVRDEGAAMPAQRNYSPTSTTGRGLHLVEHMADRWGTDLVDAGKSVWFEIDTPDAAPSGVERRHSPHEGAQAPDLPSRGPGGAVDLRHRGGVASVPAA